MPQLTCPKCGSTHCARARRQGFLQTVIFVRLGRFPWVCKDCNTSFYAGTRGKRKEATRPGLGAEADSNSL